MHVIWIDTTLEYKLEDYADWFITEEMVPVHEILLTSVMLSLICRSPHACIC